MKSLVPFETGCSRVSYYSAMAGRVPVMERPVPALLTRGLTMIAVHTGYYEDMCGDTNRVCKGPLIDMFQRFRFDHVYEHEARNHYPSYLDAVHRYGIRIDNEVFPGSYSIPDLHGNHFVLAGGGFDACHGRAFKTLIGQIALANPESSASEVRIDIPRYSTYYNYQDGAEGEIWMESAVAASRDFFPYYSRMLDVLRPFGFILEHYTAAGLQSYMGIDVAHPAVRVRIIDDSALMGELLRGYSRA